MISFGVDRNYGECDYPEWVNVLSGWTKGELGKEHPEWEPMLAEMEVEARPRAERVVRGYRIVAKDC